MAKQLYIERVCLENNLIELDTTTYTNLSARYQHQRASSSGFILLSATTICLDYYCHGRNIFDCLAYVNKKYALNRAIARECCYNNS